MDSVPREAFIPDAHKHEALGDHPVPIGYEQTISQPYMVAWMTQALGVERGMRVLEIGTGCGYQTAILTELGARVYSLEIVPQLSEMAGRTLKALGYEEVHLRVASGYDGWPDEAPFDRIILTAAPPEVPTALIEQLADHGRLIAPVGTDDQVIEVVERDGGTVTRRDSLPVRFVPMKKVNPGE